MSDAAEGLRKVLDLEQRRKFADTSVIGGLDRYLLRFAGETQLSPSHGFSRVLQALPPGGYHALHPVQRRRVVEELLKAMAAEPLTRNDRDGDGGARPDGQTADKGRPSGRIIEFPAAAAKNPATKPASRTRPDGRTALAAPPAGRESIEAIGRLDSPVTVLKGVSKSMATKLKRLNVESVEDFLFHFPVRYDEYQPAKPIADLRPGEHQTIIAHVWSSGASVIGGRKKVTEAIVNDGTGSIRVIWWSGPWVARRLYEGMKVALSGKVTAFRGRLQMENPEFGDSNDETLRTRRIVPVYPSTKNLEQRDILSLKGQAVRAFATKLPETLPEAVRPRLRLPAAPEAMRRVHLPDTRENAEAGTRRFAFEELLVVELGVIKRRREWQTSGSAPVLAMPHALRDGFIGSLPFEMTSAQRGAIDTILADIGRDVPMSRLLEGDVGSGKTVVAAAALLAAVACGYQGAIMAPTEILAEQHFKTFCRLLSPGGEVSDGVWFQETGPGYLTLRPPFLDRPVNVALLRGSLKAAEKSAAREAIGNGSVDIAVGTHALIQGDVEFSRLGLVVVDEQHRFGVEQRAALREKGGTPHVLVMTATPIPRTLALTVYGDLDITVLDEMPPGRPETKTYRVPPRQRVSAYKFVRDKVAEGRQAYVICPLVEESETIQTKAAVQEYGRLARDVFPDLRLGLLHGRMTPAEKDATMRAFRDGDLDILVSTAVVEVGIDVPNATVILIEAADRFGLTQLHQFRGRVRRSELPSTCLLLFDEPSEEGEERLRIMESTSDGFKLAEEDLRLRGPGEYFGTRQSGLPDLRVAKLTDTKLIQLAKDEATVILDADPNLERPDHAALRARVRTLWDRLSAEVS